MFISKCFQNIPRVFFDISFVNLRKSLIFNDPNNVGLYYYVKMHVKNLPKIFHFGVILESSMNPSRNNFFYYNVLQMFLSTTFVIFIPNHSTCVHNVFETLLCKHIKEVYNINIFFNVKT
jgi:hypothetical protein